MSITPRLLARDDLFEESQRFDRIQMPLLHHEPNEVPAALASVAAPDALLQAYREGGRALLMEGAEPPPLPALLSERRPEGLNRVDNVGAAHGVEPGAEVLVGINTRTVAVASCSESALTLLHHVRQLMLQVRNPIAEGRLVKEREVSRVEVSEQQRKLAAALIGDGGQFRIRSALDGTAL